jgi:hypothetical protein
MRRRPWFLVVLAGLASILCYSPFLFLKYFDFESIFYLLFLAFAFFVFLIVVAARGVITKRWVDLKIFLAVMVFLATSFLMFLATDHLRPWARWLTGARHYKQEVQLLPADPRTGIRLMEWDGWGFAGSDTSVILMYEPTDTLGEALRKHTPGRFAEFAKHVWSYERLERCWNSVTFYTNDAWDPSE